ncbi:MAG TPA: Ig-like domain-containing protein [Pseudomonadales bacterium]|nr:Ig-like domain-containing protein [Pseudomonadales bacterium]
MPINSAVTAAFSKRMNAASITTSSFTLQCPDGSAVTATVGYVEASRVATLTPAADLPVSTTCTATVTVDAVDTVGISLAQNFVWQFTTGVATDTTRPRVTMTVPVTTTPGPTLAIATNTSVAATFTEDMLPASFTATSFTLTGPGITPVAGNVTYAVGARAATFVPDAELPAGTVMTATVTSDAADLAGNGLAGNQAALPAASDYVWTFETSAAPDTTPPTITLENPADLDIDVPINANVNVTFSEPMDPLTIISLSFILQESGPPLGPELDGVITYDVQSRVATLDPSVDLLADTNYTATVLDTATDLAGNALVAGLLPNPWTFQTAPAALPPPPPLVIDLGAATTFGLASRAGLTSTGVTVVNGDVALDPLASCTDSTGNAGASQTCLTKIYTSPTGMTVNGSIFFSGDPFDNGATALAVTNALTTAWNEGMNKIDTFATGFLGGELGGMAPNGKVLQPGVYHEAALGMSAGSVTTFDALGDLNATFIIKVDSSFVDSGTLLQPTEIKLANGAQARNIFFVLGLDATIGSGTTWFGNLLAGRTVVINDGSAVLGRALAGASGAGALTLTGAASPSTTIVTVP